MIKTGSGGVCCHNALGLVRTVRQIPPATPSGFDFLFRTRPRALWQQTPPEPVLILQSINVSYKTPSFDILLQMRAEFLSSMYSTIPVHLIWYSSIETEYLRYVYTSRMGTTTTTKNRKMTQSNHMGLILLILLNVNPTMKKN